MNNSLIRKVKNFPPLDETVAKIQEIANKKNSSLKEMTQIVEKDPMLTANILKATNSPLYGFSREIKSINQAVSLFGMATIRGFALASMMQNSVKMDLSPYNLTKNQFLDISLSQNALMFNWYSKINRSMMDILVPASFLTEIGKIILAEELKEENKAEEFSKEISNAKTILEVSNIEKKYLNISTEIMTARILEHWNFEPKMIKAIEYSIEIEKANESIKPYAIALNVVKNAINTKEDNFAETYKILEDYNLDKEQFTQALKAIGK